MGHIDGLYHLHVVIVHQYLDNPIYQVQKEWVTINIAITIDKEITMHC